MMTTVSRIRTITTVVFLLAGFCRPVTAQGTVPPVLVADASPSTTIPLMVADEVTASMETGIADLAREVRTLIRMEDPEELVPYLRERVLPALEDGAAMLGGARMALEYARFRFDEHLSDLDLEMQRAGAELVAELTRLAEETRGKRSRVAALRSRLQPITLSFRRLLLSLLETLELARVIQLSRNVSRDVEGVFQMRLDRLQSVLDELMAEFDVAASGDTPARSPGGGHSGWGAPG